MIENRRRLVRTCSIFVMFLLLTAASFKPLKAQDASLKWYSMEQAQTLAKENGKQVLVFAEAEWCVYCKKMDNNVFPKPAVIDSVQAYFYPVRVDIESTEPFMYNGEETTGRAFAMRYKVKATPTFLFLDQNGEVTGGQPGFIPAETFSKLVAFVGSGAFRKMDFKLYIKQHSN